MVLFKGKSCAVVLIVLALVVLCASLTVAKEDPELRQCKHQCKHQRQFDSKQKRVCESSCEEYIKEKERREREVGKAGEEEWDQTRRRDPEREYREKERREREVGKGEEEWDQTKGSQRHDSERERREKERREREVGRVEEEEREQTGPWRRDLPEKEYRKCRERCQGEEEGRRAQQLCESECEQRRRDEIVGKREGSDEEEEEEEEEIGGESGKPYVFQDDHFHTKLKSQEGRVRVLKRFTKRSKLFKGIENYRVVIFEANPQTFMVPNHWDADTVFFVAQGKFLPLF